MRTISLRRTHMGGVSKDMESLNMEGVLQMPEVAVDIGAHCAGALEN